MLDPGYAPTSLELSALFNEKQKYMYTVFEHVLQTDQGKAYVHDYSATYDAQSIYHDLCDYALKLTKASLDSTKLLAYITSTRYGDGKWKGTSHAFILNWQDKVHKYEALVPKKDHLHLKRKVHEISTLFT